MNNSQPAANSTALDDFRRRLKLSYNDLSEICGSHNASKSTIERLCKNAVTNDEFKANVRRRLADRLPKFLFSRGKSAAEIDFELTKIFNTEEYTPMIQPRIELTELAKQCFGLTEDPFTPAPRSATEVFQSNALESVFEIVKDAIRFQKFVVVTGEIGAGKTVLRNRVEDYVAGNASVEIIFPETFDMSRVTPGSISRAILEEFDAPRVPVDSVSRAKAVKRLLKALHSKGVNVALGFDECHRLDDNTLSSLKNFLEMGSGGFTRYLGIVLFGQPQFEARLRDFRFREIVERITVVQMPEIGNSAADYLAHRLKLAGGLLDALFSPDAVETITRAAKTPLQLGNVANAALNEAAKLGLEQVEDGFVSLKNLSDAGSIENKTPRIRKIRAVS